MSPGLGCPLLVCSDRALVSASPWLSDSVWRWSFLGLTQAGDFTIFKSCISAQGSRLAMNGPLANVGDPVVCLAVFWLEVELPGC